MGELPLPRDLWGRDLRYALLALMLGYRIPWSVPQLRQALSRQGFRDPGAKVVADALGHEVARGRVFRVDRGVYVVGSIPRRTRNRIVARLRGTPVYST